MSKTFHVNEIFYSLQGEGIRAGTANVFVRFAACNLRCDVEEGPLSPGGFACDTEFMSGRAISQGDLIREAIDVRGPRSDRDVGIILTGGEPALQVTPELVSALKVYFTPICIETNGTVNVNSLGLEWITLSPKVAEHAIKQHWANELKYVRGYGQAIPNTKIESKNRLISPAFDGGVITPKTMEWCVGLVRDNPEWRLSIQQHKIWNVR